MSETNVIRASSTVASAKTAVEVTKPSESVIFFSGTTHCIFKL